MGHFRYLFSYDDDVAGDEEGKWRWAKERVYITDAYPAFGVWGANYVKGGAWSTTYVLENVINW